MLFRRHPLGPSRGAMRRDAVLATVRHADRHINEFFGERVERARAHDFLRICPHTPQRRGMMRQYFPVVVDPIGFAGGHDVVVHGANLRRRVRVLDGRRGRADCAGGAHGTTAITRAGNPEPSSTFGKVTQTTAPASGTWSRLARSSI